MVERILDSTLGNINPSILYVCAAVLIVMLILGIVKKAMSVIVVAVILVAGCLYLVLQVVEYQENFSIGINDDSQLVIIVDGKELVIGNDEYDDDPSETVSNVDIERQPDGWYQLDINYEDSSKLTVNIPGFMKYPVIDYLKDQEMQYSLIE